MWAQAALRKVRTEVEETSDVKYVAFYKTSRENRLGRSFMR